MKLNRQRMVLVGVLGLGMIALVMDRTVFGSGDSAKSDNTGAAAAEISAAANPIVVTAPAAAVATSNSVATLLKQQHSSQSAPARDVFQTAGGWGVAPKAQERAASKEVNLVEKFQQKHRLTSVLFAGSNSQVMIDGKALVLGQKLDGFSLVGISRTHVTFRCEAGEAVLRLVD